MKGELLTVLTMTRENRSRLSRLTKAAFTTFLVVTMEEYCSANNLDIADLAEDIVQVVAGVLEYRKNMPD